MIPWRIKQALKWGKERLSDTLLSLTVAPIPLPPQVAQKRIILVGASVGKDWRLHVIYQRIETLVEYAFDKTAMVERAIAARPDAIIIKECAAYFPSTAVNRDLIAKWVERIRQAQIRPILATVVPVTREHAASHPGRVEAIWEFNDWIRDWAAAEKVPMLDLEAALRCSTEDRYLDDRLDSGDGLHLAAEAYRKKLDPLIPSLLLQTFDSNP